MKTRLGMLEKLNSPSRTGFSVPGLSAMSMMGQRDGPQGSAVGSCSNRVETRRRSEPVYETMGNRRQRDAEEYLAENGYG